MRVVAIIQARMNSRRLPGKVLLKIGEFSTLEHIIRRLNISVKINEILIATTLEKEDDAISAFCKEKNIKCYRGDTNDVLRRYVEAAIQAKADVVVRVTGDCPFIDPYIVDEVIERLEKTGSDYCSLFGEFPDGLDVSAIPIEILEKASREAIKKSEREHCTMYIEKNETIFKIDKYEKFKGSSLGSQRWTLDEPEDLIFLRKVEENIENKSDYSYKQILSVVRKNPELIKINSGIVRNEGYLNMLQHEKEEE